MTQPDFALAACGLRWASAIYTQHLGHCRWSWVPRWDLYAGSGPVIQLRYIDTKLHVTAAA